MRTDKLSLVMLAGLVLSAVGTAYAGDETPGAGDQVQAVMSLPDGRRVVVSESAQPSRVAPTGSGGAVRRQLADGSRISYGLGDAPRATRARRSATQQTPSGAASRAPAPQRTNVSTVGSAHYDADAATGGQDVRFFDAGISAMVVGRTVYIWGVDFVQSSAEFEVIEGERFAYDSVIARESDAGTGSDAGENDQMHAPIKLEYAPGTVVDLTLHASADNPESPDRAERSWTFRVR